MTISELPKTIVPNPSFRKQVEEYSGQKVSACFQCEKCTNGCPVSFAMDIVPHKTIRSVHLGLKEQVLNSDTIWVCASCETCTTRCPNGIDIAHIMDSLRQISQSEGYTPSKKTVPVLDKSFTGSIKRWGRVHEMEMAALYTLKAEGLASLINQGKTQGLDMMRKGKMKILPYRFTPHSQIKGIFKSSEKRGSR